MNNILETRLGIKSPVVRQFIIYGMVALIPTAVDFGLIYFLTEFVGLYYMFSLVIAFIIGSIVSYFAQKKLTFQDGSQKYLAQFSFFCLTNLGGLVINAGIVFGVVEYLGGWYLLGKVIASAVTYLWSFGVNRQITFKKF